MVDADVFKAVLGRWASGVTIVTSAARERIHGMTVSAFSSVSLDPPLVLVCADKTSITNELIAESGVYAAHILSDDQQALSNKFASKKDEHRRFEDVDWKTMKTGAPILPGCLAVLDCRVTDGHDAGDHIVYVGYVEAAQYDDEAPLVYYEGAYRDLAPKS
jgi:flavin reductase (DIM6/NTAB) family NADH-FMN oxidoreductase RutF